MGQTLSEPVVEKVRVCAVLRCATNLALSSCSAVITHHPRTFVLCSILLGVSLSLAHAEPKNFCHCATFAWLVIVFTKHYCSTVTTLTLITNILYFTDFLKRRR